MVDQIKKVASECHCCENFRCGSCRGVLNNVVPDDCSYKEFCGREEVMELRRTQQLVLRRATSISGMLSLLAPKEAEA